MLLWIFLQSPFTSAIHLLLRKLSLRAAIRASLRGHPCKICWDAVMGGFSDKSAERAYLSSWLLLSPVNRQRPNNSLMWSLLSTSATVLKPAVTRALLTRLERFHEDYFCLFISRVFEVTLSVINRAREGKFQPFHITYIGYAAFQQF